MKLLFPGKNINISLKHTFLNGQQFNFLPSNQDQTQFQGVLYNYHVEFIERNDKIYYSNYPNDDIEEILEDFFQANICYKDLQYSWCQDSVFRKKLKIDDNMFAQIKNSDLQMGGIEKMRILRQPVFECLVSFMVSQNNNISRIKMLLKELRKYFGTLIIKDQDFYEFPTLQQLQKGTDQKFRELGLGYRAKYLVQLCEFLSEKEKIDYKVQLKSFQQNENKYLIYLRSQPYQCIIYKIDIKKELLQINGVGNKVADCVALFCLDQSQVVPIDTHVMSIYLNDYKQKKDNYENMQLFFQKKFDCAGWAHSYLFLADLKIFETINSQEKNKPLKKIKK